MNGGNTLKTVLATGICIASGLSGTGCGEKTIKPRFDKQLEHYLFGNAQSGKPINPDEFSIIEVHSPIEYNLEQVLEIGARALSHSSESSLGRLTADRSRALVDCGAVALSHIAQPNDGTGFETAIDEIRHGEMQLLKIEEGVRQAETLQAQMNFRAAAQACLNWIFTTEKPKVVVPIGLKD